jgi:hypothetical protein
MSMAAALSASTGAHRYYPGPMHPPSHAPPYALAAAGHAHYLSAFSNHPRLGGGGGGAARRGRALADPYAGAPPMLMHPPTVKWPSPRAGGLRGAAAAAAYHGVDPGKLLLRSGRAGYSSSGEPDPGAEYDVGDADGGRDGEDCVGEEGGSEEGGAGEMAGYSDTVKRYTVDAHNQVGPGPARRESVFPPDPTPLIGADWLGC